MDVLSTVWFYRYGVVARPKPCAGIHCLSLPVLKLSIEYTSKLRYSVALLKLLTRNCRVSFLVFFDVFVILKQCCVYLNPAYMATKRIMKYICLTFAKFTELQHHTLHCTDGTCDNIVRSVNRPWSEWTPLKIRKQPDVDANSRSHRTRLVFNSHTL